MISKTQTQYYSSERLAAAYLVDKMKGQKIEYPINPFRFLKEEGVLFTLSDFHKLEGVYIPAASEDDIPTVGININRPITRQRFTAAHELCHHLRDADKHISCPIGGGRNSIEKYADHFAAALLMPKAELQKQVDKRKNAQGNVDFIAVLEIADFFGVSFETCLFRIAYIVHAIEGNTESSALKKRAVTFKPETARKAKNMTYANLYAGLIDNYQEQLAFVPTEHAKILFQNEYIYNDSRMEGLNATIEEASEIVADLRLNAQSSEYCIEKNEVYLSIAGHYSMYQDIFATPVKETISVYDAFPLNRKLFSFYPDPDYGGAARQSNTMVLGAKFETVDYHDIFTELAKVDAEIKELHEKRTEISVSEFIRRIARIHHRITVIHPFPDGNGRTTRAFMNVQLVRAGLPPIYIKAEDKSIYVDALARADKEQSYNELYEVIYKVLLKAHVALKRN